MHCCYRFIVVGIAQALSVGLDQEGAEAQQVEAGGRADGSSGGGEYARSLSHVEDGGGSSFLSDDNDSDSSNPEAK